MASVKKLFIILFIIFIPINNLFSDDTSYFVDIAMNNSFPTFLDSVVFNSLPYDSSLYSYIDTTGLTQYKWNVVTQNYSSDIYDADVDNSIISDRDLIVDLEVPIAKYSFTQSEFYEEYYDLYFQTSEKTIEEIANIWIEFEDTSIYRIPHKIDDYYFHIASTFINTGIINYNFQVRDLVENVGKTEKTIVFQFLDDELPVSVSSSDGSFSINSTINSVSKPTGILLFSEDLADSTSEIIQLTSEYHICPYNQEFLHPVQVEFNNINIDDDYWKYTIMHKQEDDWIELDSKIIDDSILANTNYGGIYAVFYNPIALEPIPDKFELVNLYPNPFNPFLTIKYNLDIEQDVSINIYNILGQRVTQLINQKMLPGYHSIQWDGTNDKGVLLGSGIYFIKISTENESYIGKVSLKK